MKKLIFLVSIILLFSCNEKSKEANETISEEDLTSEQTTDLDEKEVDYGKQIIPGKRLGPIVLQQNASAVLDSLGKPDSGDAAMGKAFSTWNEDSENLLTLYTSMKMGVEDFSRIKVIRSLSPRYKTENSIGVNSTLSEIEKYFELKKIRIFPLEGKNYSLYSSAEGIGFEIGDDQICHGIVIMESGSMPNQFYLPLYPDLKE